MSFIESPRFPKNVTAGSAGGPGFLTEIVRTGGGYEYRNQRWEYPLHRYDLAYGALTLEDLDEIIIWFHAAAGKRRRFRVRDRLDNKSVGVHETISPTDQLLGQGDSNATTEFQLVKVYERGPVSLSRRIQKPVAGTVRVALDGVEQTTGFTVDTTTGLVTFSTPPAIGVEVTAGFEFDVPVRFDTDVLQNNMDTYLSGAASIPLVEVRL